MKNHLIKNIFFWILLLLGGHLSAQSPEAEFKKLAETWTLQNDGSQEYHYYKELTLFTHTAMNSTYGQTFILYNPEFQELKIHSAYVKQKDGTIIQTPANAFVEVLPQSAADAPAYNHLKEMVIVHTGLELGATIYLDYSVISKPGYLTEIDVCQFLEESSPIKEYTLTFNLPASTTAHYDIHPSKVLPVKSTHQDMQQLKWTFRNLPALSREHGCSMQNGDLAVVLFSTYQTPQQALQKLYRQMDQTITPPIAALAQNLTKTCQTDTEKLQVIQRYIKTHLGDCPLFLNKTGFRFRPVAEVISTAYGTDTEKVNLMISLLQACGIEAHPFATYPVPVDPDCCGLKAIGELLVHVRADGKTYWLNTRNISPVAENCCFLLNMKNGEKVLPDQSPASINYKATLTINDQQGNAEIQATFGNRFISCGQAAYSILPQMTDLKITPESETTIFSGKYTIGLEKVQAYLLLNLPSTYKGIGQTAYLFANSKRNKNLLLPAQVNESYSYEIQVPENLVLCTPVKEKKIVNAAGTLTLCAQLNGSILKIHRSLQLNERLITPTNYAAYRKLILEWADKNNQTLLFKERGR